MGCYKVPQPYTELGNSSYLVDGVLGAKKCCVDFLRGEGIPAIQHSEIIHEGHKYKYPSLLLFYKEDDNLVKCRWVNILELRKEIL